LTIDELFQAAGIIDNVQFLIMGSESEKKYGVQSQRRDKAIFLRKFQTE
jgi:hypothetical protein